MTGLRFSDVHPRPTELLDLRSLTGEEFACLLPAFETVFRQRMATWRLDGKPRTARRFSVYRACPLPTPEDRLLFVLVYLKTYALQVVHGGLFGLSQSKANQWLQVLLPVLQAALTALGDTPSRTLAALAERWGLSAEAAAVLLRPPEPPLLPMLAPNGGSTAPRMRLSRRAVIAARRSAIP